MEAAARLQPLMTDEERELLIELLERERSDLPAEIHHTRTAEVRAQLKLRLATVQRLLERLGADVGP